MNQRIVSLLLAAVLLLSLLTACGAKSPAPAPETAPSETTETSADGKEELSAAPEQENTSTGDEQAPDAGAAENESKKDPAPGEADASAVSGEAPSAGTVSSGESSEISTDAGQAPPAPATSARALLNAAPLSPMKTNDAALDAMVEDILAQILTDDMDTYEKVKACYDYLIENTRYQTKSEATVIRSGVYASTEDYKTVLLSSEVLSTGKGVCDHYAAALHVLTRRIGLESYFCTGKHASQKGGMGGHVWTVITLGGTDYIFDAQIDDTTNGNYSRFCKTFDEMGSRYQDYNVAQNKAEFCNFQLASSVDSSDSDLLAAFFASDPQLMANLDESIAYSEAVAYAATALRAEYGLGTMRTDDSATMVACYCALAGATGDQITTEEAADLLLEQGVSFRYLVVIPFDGAMDAETLVDSEVSAFTNTNFNGFSAGVYDGAWVVLFYGG